MPLCWWFDKKGERNFGVLYMHVYACLFHFLVLQKEGKEFWEFIYAYLFSCLMHICFVYAKKGEKYFMSLYMFTSIYAYLLWAFIAYLYVYCYAWVKGELLWSLTLIQHITPWVLSSSKRGRLLAQSPITLVLIMINLCTYSLLIILWYLVSDIWSRY